MIIKRTKNKIVVKKLAAHFTFSLASAFLSYFAHKILPVLANNSL